MFSKSATAEPQTAQMTIFYAGRVIVFNDFPADKAKEVMLLASKGSSQIQNAFPSIPANSHPALAPNISKTPIESTISIPSSSNAHPNFGNNLIQECMQPAPQPIANGKLFPMISLFAWTQIRESDWIFWHHVSNKGFSLELQIFQLQGELPSTGFWRREKTGRRPCQRKWKSFAICCGLCTRFKSCWLM